MSLKSVQYMAYSATSIASLAKCVYIHPDIGPNMFGMGEYTPSWYHNEHATSENLAHYLAKETNGEKIAVLLHYLHSSLMRINYEVAFIECCKPDVKNMIALSELSRLGIKTNIKNLPSNYINSCHDIAKIYTNTDLNLERKTRNPQFALVRTENILAISQAIYLLGIPSKQTHDIETLLDMAIKKDNEEAFEYIIHSNIKFDLTALVFKILDSKKPNSRMLKELCRRGYKVGACVKNDITAIEYAIGIIPATEFDCFFYKAGRLVYQDPVDAEIIDKVESIMKKNEIISNAIKLKKYNFLSYDELKKYDIPDMVHKKTAVDIRKNNPVFDRIAIPKIHKCGIEDSDFLNIPVTENETVTILFGVSKTENKYYVSLSRDMVKISKALEDIIDSEIDDCKTTIVSDVRDMITDPFAFSIVLSYMMGMSKNIGDMITDEPATWMKHLFDLNLPTLLTVYNIASYLDIRSIYKPLSWFVNKESEKYNVEELRFIVSKIPNIDMNFDTITFKNVIKRNGFSYGEV